MHNLATLFTLDAPLQTVLASVGSLGDVHPFVAIGQSLKLRGHRVTVICNDDFRSVVTDAGLTQVSAGAAINLKAAVASPNLWHPIKGLGVFWKHMLAPAIEPTFRQIERLRAEGPCVVVAPPSMFGARFARDALGVPLLSAYTAPAVLRSDGAPLAMAHWRLPRGTPRPLVRLAWQALDRHKLHPMAERTLQRLAGELGCAPPPAAHSIFGEWMFSPDGGLTLFPEWFAPTRPGWPLRIRFGGFPLFHESGAAALPEAVLRFLQAGTPPVVFMPGSAMQHATAFFAAALGACQQLGQRALLLTPHRAQLPPTLPDAVLHADYLPFATLLPGAAALVHHGGIGTCAQALRAGVPQVIMPMAHDQFDNAECVQRLGAGAVLRRHRFTAERLAATLRTLWAAPPHKLQACRQRLAEPALPLLCDEIEAWMSRAQARAQSPE